MDQLRKREDVQNKSYCALVASLVAVVATLVPRSAQRIPGQLELDERGRASDAFIGRCLQVCHQSRGPVRSGQDVDDAATSFFIGLVYYLRGSKGEFERYASESLSIVQYLGVARLGISADGSRGDPVSKELCKRIFWAVYSMSR